jgi:hypothetical protein
MYCNTSWGSEPNSPKEIEELRNAVKRHLKENIRYRRDSSW